MSTLKRLSDTSTLSYGPSKRFRPNHNPSAIFDNPIHNLSLPQVTTDSDNGFLNCKVSMKWVNMVDGDRFQLISPEVSQSPRFDLVFSPKCAPLLSQFLNAGDTILLSLQGAKIEKKPSVDFFSGTVLRYESHVVFKWIECKRNRKYSGTVCDTRAIRLDVQDKDSVASEPTQIQTQGSPGLVACQPSSSSPPIPLIRLSDIEAGDETDEEDDERALSNGSAQPFRESDEVQVTPLPGLSQALAHTERAFKALPKKHRHRQLNQVQEELFQSAITLIGIVWKSTVPTPTITHQYCLALTLVDPPMCDGSLNCGSLQYPTFLSVNCFNAVDGLLGSVDEGDVVILHGVKIRKSNMETGMAVQGVGYSDRLKYCVLDKDTGEYTTPNVTVPPKVISPFYLHPTIEEKEYGRSLAVWWEERNVALGHRRS